MQAMIPLDDFDDILDSALDITPPARKGKTNGRHFEAFM